MQQEGYDIREEFVSAGFAAEDDDGIHLAGQGMVRRLALSVRHSVPVPTQFSRSVIA